MIVPDKLVVDSSIVAKWYVEEADSDQAAQVQKSGTDMLAPDFLVIELTSILWKRVRRGELLVDEAVQILGRFEATDAVRLQPTGSLIAAALRIAARYDRSVYDCLYLALAMQERCQMITADNRLYNRLQGTEMESYIVTLGRY